MTQLAEVLDGLGVKHFAAAELLRVRHVQVARRVGVPIERAGRRWVFADPPDSVLVELGRIAAAADALREAIGAPVVVLNGWRPEPYNRAVGGAARSQHLTGRALDLVAADLPKLHRVAFAAWVLGGVRGLGLYRGNVHVDLRPSPRRVWGSRAEAVAAEVGERLGLAPGASPEDVSSEAARRPRHELLRLLVG